MTEAKDLRIIILTSDAIHHCHYVRAISEHANVVRVMEERRPFKAGFETRHAFEDDRDALELSRWFGGREPKLAEMGEVSTYFDLNDPDAVAEMRELKPDALFVFGTGLLGPEVLSVRADRIVNMHGADPERYRGLDTHLWACYHKDFTALVTTMQRAHVDLDRGGVVQRQPLTMHKGMGIAELRAANTETSIELTVNGLHMLAHYDQFISQPQRYVGRLYSHMPAVLKDRARDNFERWTATL